MNYMTNKIIAIQGDSPSKLNAETDTSIFLANEIQKKRYKIFYYEPKDLSIINSKLLCIHHLHSGTLGYTRLPSYDLNLVSFKVAYHELNE